ncbi:MAG: hypothetical protein ACYSUN_03790 [Planctomycetota bacterium]|jgi:hypothetical protein
MIKLRGWSDGKKFAITEAAKSATSYSVIPICSLQQGEAVQRSDAQLLPA